MMTGASECERPSYKTPHFVSCIPLLGRSSFTRGQLGTKLSFLDSTRAFRQESYTRRHSGFADLHFDQTHEGWRAGTGRLDSPRRASGAVHRPKPDVRPQLTFVHHANPAHGPNHSISANRRRGTTA